MKAIKKLLYNNPNVDIPLFQFVLVRMDVNSVLEWTATVAEGISQCKKPPSSWGDEFVLAITGGQHTYTAIKEILAADADFFVRNSKHANIDGKVYAIGALAMFDLLFKAAMRNQDSCMINRSKVVKESAVDTMRNNLISRCQEFGDLTAPEWLAIPDVVWAVLNLRLEHNRVGSTVENDSWLQKFSAARCVSKADKEKNALEDDVNLGDTTGAELRLIFECQDVSRFEKVVSLPNVEWRLFRSILTMDAKGALRDQENQIVTKSVFQVKPFLDLAQLRLPDVQRLLAKVKNNEIGLKDLKENIKAVQVLYYYLFVT